MSDDDAVKRSLAQRPTELEYLRSVEQLAKSVVSAAYDEWGVEAVLTQDPKRAVLESSITELARSIRRVHFEGDGCVPDHFGEDGYVPAAE